jgi:hypothetical protein
MSLLYYLGRSASIQAEPPLVNSKKMNAFIRPLIYVTAALGTGTTTSNLDHAVLQTVVHGDRCGSSHVQMRLMTAPGTDAVEEVGRFGHHVPTIREAGAEDALRSCSISYVLDELLEEADVVQILLCRVPAARGPIPALVVAIRRGRGPAS